MRPLFPPLPPLGPAAEGMDACGLVHLVIVAGHHLHIVMTETSHDKSWRTDVWLSDHLSVQELLQMCQSLECPSLTRFNSSSADVLSSFLCHARFLPRRIRLCMVLHMPSPSPSPITALRVALLCCRTFRPPAPTEAAFHTEIKPIQPIPLRRRASWAVCCLVTTQRACRPSHSICTSTL